MYKLTKPNFKYLFVLLFFNWVLTQPKAKLYSNKKTEKIKSINEQLQVSKYLEQLNEFCNCKEQRSTVLKRERRIRLLNGGLWYTNLHN